MILLYIYHVKRIPAGDDYFHSSRVDNVLQKMMTSLSRHIICRDGTPAILSWRYNMYFVRIIFTDAWIDQLALEPGTKNIHKIIIRMPYELLRRVSEHGADYYLVASSCRLHYNGDAQRYRTHFLISMSI